MKDLPQAPDNGVVPPSSRLFQGRGPEKLAGLSRASLQNWCRIMRTLAMDESTYQKLNICTWSAGTAQHRYCGYNVCPVCTARLIASLVETYKVVLPMKRKELRRDYKDPYPSPPNGAKYFRTLRLQYNKGTDKWFQRYQFYMSAEITTRGRRGALDWYPIMAEAVLLSELHSALGVPPEVYCHPDNFKFYLKNVKGSKKVIYYGIPEQNNIGV